VDFVEKCKSDHLERGRAFESYSGRVDEVLDSTKKQLKKITNELNGAEAQRSVGPLIQDLSLDAFVDRFKTDCTTYIQAAA
jgi:hypothetical protein